MSCGSCPWIVPTLVGITVAVFTPIAPLPAFSQPHAASVASLSERTPGAANLSVALAPADEKMLPCNSTHPIFCIYASRDWLSQLEPTFWTSTESVESQQDLEDNHETVDSAQSSATASDLGRRIRFLTRLKTWLDAISQD